MKSSRLPWIAVVSGACLLVCGLYPFEPALAQDQARMAAGKPLNLLTGVKPSATAPARTRGSATGRKMEATANRGARSPKPPVAVTPPVPVVQTPAQVEPVTKIVAPTPAPSPPAAPVPEQRLAAIEPVAAKPTRSTLAQDYCANFSNAASEFRFAWQMQQLTELEGQIKQRIAELDARRAELAQWQEKQEEFRRKAEEGVVAIYSRMRPDAASSQLAVMEEAGAAAILAKLSPKTASLLLNEMNAAKAAKLADLMTTGSIDANKK